MEKESFLERVVSDLDFAAEAAEVLWRRSRALEELVREPCVLRALRGDAALFAVLLLRLPSGVFRPFPFQVDFLRDRRKRVVVCCGRQVGKTTMAAAKAVWFAVMRVGVTVLIVSRAMRQSMWLFRKVREMVFGSSVLRKLVKGRGEGTTMTQIEFKAPLGSRIVALPPGAEGDTIRGLTADMLILDEANFVKPSIITSVCLPMISATDGYLVMISTPECGGHPFMEAFERAEEWGYSRYHFPSSIAPIPSREARVRFLEEQRRRIPEDEFLREYMAVLPDESDQLIKSKYIRACVEDYELIREDELMERRFKADWAGYDPGGKRDPAAFVALRREGDKARIVFVRERLGEEYGAFSAFVKFAWDRLGLGRIAVDETGLGKPIVEDLVNMGLPIRAVNVTKRVKLDLFRWLTVCFEQGKVVIPDDEKLLLQLKSIRRRYVKVTDDRSVRARLKISHPTNVHDDIVYALALALYTMRKEPKGRLIPIH